MNTAPPIHRDTGKPNQPTSARAERSIPVAFTAEPTHQADPHPSREGGSLLTREQFAYAFQVGYGPTVHALRTYGISWNDAFEVAEHAWVKAFVHLDRLRDPRNILRWVRMIAINAWRDDRRCRARLCTLVGDYPAPIHVRDSVIDIERVIASSTPGQGVIIERLLEGHSTAEIAKLFGISRGAVLARISRAVRSARRAAERKS